jgi:hypothetical protein
VVVNKSLGIAASVSSFFEESGPVSLMVSTMQLFQALLANGNLQSAAIILQELPHDLLLFIIKISFLPSSLRTSFYDVLMALHLTVHKEPSSNPFYLLSLGDIRESVEANSPKKLNHQSVTQSRIMSRMSPSRASASQLDEVMILWSFCPVTFLTCF